MSRARKLTPDREAELRERLALRRTLTNAALCREYEISDSTLRRYDVPRETTEKPSIDELMSELGAHQ